MATSEKSHDISQNNKKQFDNIFSIIWNDIKERWNKNIIETLNYKPDPEKLVQLHCKSGKEKEEILANPKYLGKTCHIQIGKTQNDGGTLYSNEMLEILIEYLINHAKDGENPVIQIWSDVGGLLLQGNEEGVIPTNTQLDNLKKFIKDRFGKRGDCIDVIIGSEQKRCKNFFDKLRKRKEGERRFGLIPENEPNLEEYLSETKKEKLSPLPIIQYLAYHANKDPELMALFYNTKPPLYRKMDGENHIPGSSDADYYGIVEVGLRLTEILKGISIQGGAGRQRVYDKIISIILYGKDEIPKNKECSYKLVFYKKSTDKKNPEIIEIGSKGLYKLYEIIKNAKLQNEGGLNTDFKQLYIESDRNSLDKIREKTLKKKGLKGSLIISGIRAGLAAALFGVCFTINEINQERENKKLEEKKELYLEKVGKESPVYKTSWHILQDMRKYQAEQRNILRSKYDISRYDTENYNKILEEYDRAFDANYELYQSWLSAKDFIKATRRKLAMDDNFFPEDFDENSKEDEKE